MTHWLMFSTERTKAKNAISSEPHPPDEHTCCAFISWVTSVDASAPTLWCCSEHKGCGCEVRRYEQRLSVIRF